MPRASGVADTPSPASTWLTGTSSAPPRVTRQDLAPLALVQHDERLAGGEEKAGRGEEDGGGGQQGSSADGRRLSVSAAVYRRRYRHLWYAVPPREVERSTLSGASSGLTVREDDSCSRHPPGPRADARGGRPAPRLRRPRPGGRRRPRPTTPRIVHALGRLGYGARPGDVEAVRRMGLARYVERAAPPRAHPGRSRAGTAAGRAAHDGARHGRADEGLPGPAGGAARGARRSARR